MGREMGKVYRVIKICSACVKGERETVCLLSPRHRPGQIQPASPRTPSRYPHQHQRTCKDHYRPEHPPHPDEGGTLPLALWIFWYIFLPAYA
eukprot:1389157-Amorphochlora_amoeboformis.AAC.1